MVPEQVMCHKVHTKRVSWRSSGQEASAAQARDGGG